MFAPLDLVVLVTLSRAPDGTHGYDLLQTIRDEQEVEVATTSLYRALRRLLDQGLVEEVELEAGEDPRRRRYRITSAGLDAIAAERRRLTKLFGGALRPARARA